MHDQRSVSDADWCTGAGGSLEHMPTLVRDPQPAEFEALLERRRRLGQDLFDEVWEGVLHMNPAPSGRHARIEAQLLAILQGPAAAAGLTVVGQFNLGEDEHDYRVPDGGLHRDFTDRVFYPTAALVIEIVSPGDESWGKLDFYAAHWVEELLIVDPQERTVSWMGLEAGEYKHLKRSRLIELGANELAARIDWP
jgi:Uma2 family endonuclease